MRSFGLSGPSTRSLPTAANTALNVPMASVRVFVGQSEPLRQQDGPSGAETRSRNQGMQMRKENSRQCLFQACEA
jgi:hypothetical protein